MIDLGLKSNLDDYNVPRADLRKIAVLALGNKDDPNVDNVVRLLQGLYKED